MPLEAHVSAAIPVYKNATIFGTRRIQGGLCTLTPNPEVRNIVLYLALHYAARYRIRLLVLCILSNHVHWVADDPDGNYPAFLTAFHARVAEVLNDYYGTSGPMWANEKPGRVRLADRQTMMEKMLYVATNATWHGIVGNTRLWPGFIFSPEDAGEVIEATCPDYLLENYNSFKPTISYTVPVPALYGNMPLQKVREDFRLRRRRREARLRKERDGEFISIETALAVAPDYAPPEKDDPRELRNQVFACSPENLESELTSLCTFRRRHNETRRRFVDGERDVAWPVGTYAMVVWHKCPCERLT